MTTYGLTDSGFVAKTREIILAEMHRDLQDAFGESIDLENGLLAKLSGIMSERYADLWELAEEVNSSQNPDQASGVQLEDVCLLTGTFKIYATYSTVTLTLTGTPATVVPILSRSEVTSTTELFVHSEEATIVVLESWLAATAYAVDDRVTNGARCYICITAGTSAGSGGPTTTDADITDNTAHWRYLGEGTGAVDVPAQALTLGIVIGVSGDITSIDTPVSGWQSVINIEDATVGYDDQPDESLRVAREDDLAHPGTGTAAAIRAEILRLTGVTSATVFMNNTDATVDGMTPHSVEALVRGGDDQDIWDALGRNVPAGIESIGAEVGAYVDTAGESQVMRFSRPVEIDIWLDLTIEKDPDHFPEDGEDQIKLALVTWGDEQETGRNVVASRIAKVAMIDDSVLDVTAVLMGTVNPAASSTTIQIANRELAVYDTARISITLSDGEP